MALGTRLWASAALGSGLSAGNLPDAALMPRDHRKLRVFVRADQLVLRVYHATRGLPVEERFGLNAQLRRAAVSVASNLVEGCARTSDKDYGRFINVAFGSAAETHYLLTVIRRLELIADDTMPMEKEYELLLRELNKLLSSIDEFE